MYINHKTSSNEFSNFQTIKMSAFNENKPDIKQGAQGEYYEVDGIKYTGTFPYEWATDHKFLDGSGFCSGPKGCWNCRVSGSINGVFVFYCANCSQQIYDGEMHPKRNGFIYAAEDLETDKELWEACPYMQGIPRSQIGDNERQLERERYWARRAKYWDAYYDENSRSIFDEGFREPAKEPQDPLGDKVAEEEPTSDNEDRFFSYYAADNVIKREIEGQQLREFNERQLQMAGEICEDWGQEAEEEVDEEEEKARCKAELEYQREQQDRIYEEEEEDEFEAYKYRDNSDYFDAWDEPYSDECPITRYELSRLPSDMRAAFDPEYQEALANFRAAAMEK